MENVIWFDRDQFSNKLSQSLPIKFQEFDFCSFALRPETLEMMIPTKADDFVAPWTDPGPCLKWFGCFENVYFQLTARFGHNPFADVYVFSSEPRTIDWRIFKRLNLAPQLIKRLIWIKGSDTAPISLFCVDNENLSCEFYRASDLHDAEELKEYLTQNKFRRDLFIAPSENPEYVWTVQKEKQIVARYTSRYACEKYAVRMSKQDESFYLVGCETNIEIPPKMFQNGKLYF